MRIVTSHIIRLSYPWIGIPMEMLRARNQSTTPFLIAHITRYDGTSPVLRLNLTPVVTCRVVIYYVFYEACQVRHTEHSLRPRGPHKSTFACASTSALAADVLRDVVLRPGAARPAGAMALRHHDAVRVYRAACTS